MKKYIDIEENRHLESVIDRLISADEDARRLTDQAVLEKKKVEESIAEKKAAIKEKYLEKARKRVDDIKLEENTALNSAIERLENNFTKNTAELSAEAKKILINGLTKFLKGSFLKTHGVYRL